MTARERHEAIRAGERPDHIPVAGIAIWEETRERWEQEGMPRDVNPNVVLGLGENDRLGLPLNLNMVPPFPVEVLAEDGRYVTVRDENGITKRMLRTDFDRSGGLMAKAGATSSMSQWLDFPVKDLASWEALREERFRVNLAERLPSDWERTRMDFRQRAETHWVTYFCFPLFGLFGGLRQLRGFEGLVFAMADQPALIHKMANDLVDFWLSVFAQVLQQVRLDEVTFFEDMASTKSPLLSPAAFREFLAPTYRRLCGGLADLGVAHRCVDSDGNVQPLLPDLVACGVTGISPCEVQSGMDAGLLRQHFPSLTLHGGIDKRALAQDRDAIDRELDRRLATAWLHSKYLPAPDHSLPPDVSWENVRYYAERYRQGCYLSAPACTETPQQPSSNRTRSSHGPGPGRAGE